MTHPAFGYLSSLFKRGAGDFRLAQPEAFAHLVIDVQRKFCDPAYDRYGTRKTANIADNIARVTEDFRAAGMPTYMVYYQRWNEPPEQAFGGFYKVRPAANDIMFGKIFPSAFEDGELAGQLRKAGAKTLLVSGFDIENCVNATVQDALRESFNVWVLSDCIGNGGSVAKKPVYIKLMRDNGAELMTARQVQRRLQHG